MKLQLLHLMNYQNNEMLLWWLHSRKLVPKDARRGFDSLVMLISWSIWKERNSWTFRGLLSLPLELTQSINYEAFLWLQVGYRHLRSLIVYL